MVQTRWSIVLILPAAAAAYACGSLDKEPNDDYNGLRNQSPISVLESTDSGVCAPIDAGKCLVSFKDDIAPLFDEGACWSSSCHGEKYLPKMKKDDLQATWESLRRHINPTFKKPYINACTIDPDASYIVDNLNGAQTGGLQMPQGLTFVPQKVEKFSQWVACGAPFN
jgi:hypothetical protein